MWMVTENEAVEMYARAYAKWHKASAVRLAREKARDLQKLGDAKGFTVWSEVAELIDRQRQESRPH